ncbi:hypothetical protein QR680_012428 [Steinernema hermaphroditum]|uniref:Serpentine receptor class gamma n=1 Tax=Steinernema hermaphroditum TaxID=289476 RepID=A0AA39M0H6_9BILA|nr:hypothetical protein QR680_012428 [Steinernema hermaphroditum]
MIIALPRKQLPRTLSVAALLPTSPPSPAFPPFSGYRASLLETMNIGYLYISLGFVYIVPGLICFFVLTQPPLVNHSCFKIMSFISLLDIANIVACCFLAGFYSITQATFETTPSMLTVGAVTLALWVSYCALNIVLAINRLLNFFSKSLEAAFFKNHRVYLWLFVAAVAGVQMLVPVDGQLFYHYDSSIGGWRFELRPLGTVNYRHMVINITTFAILFSLYSVIIYFICKKTPDNPTQSMAAMQLAAICGFAMGADIFCIVVQNIERPSIALCHMANMSWQLAHGGTGYVCLFMNRSIRNSARNLFKRHCPFFKWKKPKPPSIVITPTQVAPFSVYYVPQSSSVNHK